VVTCRDWHYRKPETRVGIGKRQQWTLDDMGGTQAKPLRFAQVRNSPFVQEAQYWLGFVAVNVQADGCAFVSGAIEHRSYQARMKHLQGLHGLHGGMSQRGQCLRLRSGPEQALVNAQRFVDFAVFGQRRLRMNTVSIRELSTRSSKRFNS